MLKSCRRCIATLLVLIAAVPLLGGCSGEKGSGKPKTTKVTGTVNYGGAPVADATVSFHPQGDTRAAYARTGADGKFQLTTTAANDGAMPGDYAVTVTKVTDENAGPPSTDIAATPKPPKLKSWLPEKYGKPETSGLSFKVTAEEPHDFTLDLKD